MNYSDDKFNRDERNDTTEAEQSVNPIIDLDSDSAPQTAEAESEKKEDTVVHADDASERSSGKRFNIGGATVGELASVAVKAVAVALSVVLLLTCILAVAMPLSAMRVFNKLGMSARAVDFGERYISAELDDYDADFEDELGNYDKVSVTPELSNSEFTEALYVCINLSYKMMNEYYEKGDSSLGEYYARRVEKYTRMYMSLNNISAINADKSAFNISQMPLLAMRPVVYSYAHSIRVMNYRARAYLGTTERALYNNGRNEKPVTQLSVLSNTFYGLNIPSDRASLMSVLDNFVDYAHQLGEYLDVEFIKAGVENDLSKRDQSDTPVVSELFVGNNYIDVLKGNEFSLIVNKNGYTNFYTQFKRFGEYAQAAVDFTPNDSNNNKLDEQLHQLYWLQALASVAQRFMYMELLTYYNRYSFGAVAMNQILAEYMTCSQFQFVEYNGKPNTIVGVYQDKLKAYISQYQS